MKFTKIVTILTLLTLAVSCMDSPSSGSRLREATGSHTPIDGNGDPIGNGSGSNAPDDTTDTGITLSDARVELTYLVDPFDGSYKTKLTLPKNFEGQLYISGINITSLNGRHLKVRFRFGMDSAAITVPAIPGKGKNGGLVPQTDNEVLVMNFTAPPFKNMGLFYDLYDYKQYNFTNGDTIITDNRDVNLYCRGLKLEHDPTYVGASNSTCSSATSKCLYAFAKVNDSGLVDAASSYTVDPKSPQVFTLDSSGNISNTESEMLLKCLADDGSTDILKTLFGGWDGSGSKVINGVSYTYSGPYYRSSESLWQLSNDALFGPFGLFAYESGVTNTLKQDIKSNMFPRAGQMDLRTGVPYFGSNTVSGDPFVAKSYLLQDSNGDSSFMDGSNIRMSTRDDFNGETVGSCNVTASIEVIAVNTDLTEEIVASTNDLKLQLVKPSTKNYLGEEVLVSSFKSCTTSNECGSEECCFNRRCWSKNIVSQCKEDAADSGNGETGDACTSDYQCQSLCCDGNTGKCNYHINTDEQVKLCNKDSGESCVATEFCRPQDVTVYKVYKILDVDPETGNPKCALRGFPEKRYGSCTDSGSGNKCVPPVAPTPEDINEVDCSTAPNLPQS